MPTVRRFRDRQVTVGLEMNLGDLFQSNLGVRQQHKGLQPTNVAYGCLWANRLLFSGDEHRDLDANWDLKRLA